ncbi:MAG TPA: cold shock domain-containing protein [Rugosimonospora sp.]|nr:cold shock domain-containing protein [Rugosimonospora sp.]
MITGKVVRFDEARGYGFIAPDNGGDDVFVHASELTDRGVAVACGTRVQFNIVDGGRGLKAYDVRVVGEEGAPAAATTTTRAEPGEAATDDDGCEVFSESEFTSQVTDLLLTAVPQLTGAQILELRKHLLQFGRRNGWVD